MLKMQDIWWVIDAVFLSLDYLDYVTFDQTWIVLIEILQKDNCGWVTFDPTIEDKLCHYLVD